MELKIYNPQEDGYLKSIDWNKDEIKAEVAERMTYYANRVYTDDTIKTRKEDRRTLNKFLTALEGKRKEVKKRCLAPYEKFEKELGEITSLVREPIALIDKQITDYDTSLAEAKKAEITEIWGKTAHPDFVTLSTIWNEKWLNKTFAMANVKKEIELKLKIIDEDLTTIKALPEFAFEAEEIYKQTLNINTAIAEGKRLADIRQRKAERQKAVERIKRQEVKPQPASTATQATSKPEVKRVWVGFKAYLSVEEANALKEFFNSRNIEFQPVKG